MNIVKFKTRDGHQLDAYLTLPPAPRRPTALRWSFYPTAVPGRGTPGALMARCSFWPAAATRSCSQTTRLERLWLDVSREGQLGFRQDARRRHGRHQGHDRLRTDRSGTNCDHGRSFGGYLAVAGVVHEPTLSLCGDIAGVFDWNSKSTTKNTTSMTPLSSDI